MHVKMLALYHRGNLCLLRHEHPGGLWHCSLGTVAWGWRGFQLVFAAECFVTILDVVNKSYLH